MKLLSRGRGQLLIYFLVIATFTAIIWGTILKFNMQEYNRQLRQRYVIELKSECDYNMAQCRAAMTDAEVDSFMGGAGHTATIIKTRALRNFIKVIFRQFNFSSAAWEKWFALQKRIEALDLLKGDAKDVEADSGYCGDIYEVYYDLNLFLIKAQGNNYNFKFM